MENVNAVIDLNVRRLNFPLVPLHPCKGRSFTVLLRNVPADVTDVHLRVFNAEGAFYDIRANERRDGTRLAYVIGTCFPAAANVIYEIHATDARGNPAALGWGVCSVGDFSAPADAVEPSAPLQVAKIPAKDGGWVSVCMIKDEFGNWVYEADVSQAGTQQEDIT